MSATVSSDKRGAKVLRIRQRHDHHIDAELGGDVGGIIALVVHAVQFALCRLLQARIVLDERLHGAPEGAAKRAHLRRVFREHRRRQNARTVLTPRQRVEVVLVAKLRCRTHDGFEAQCLNVDGVLAISAGALFAHGVGRRDFGRDFLIGQAQPASDGC